MIGKYHTLKVVKETSSGYILDNENDGILLPGVFVKGEIRAGDEVRVFIYKDSQNRLIATLDRAKLALGEFAFLEVVEKNDFGVFVDIGISKDVLVPKKMQKGELRVGKSYLFALSVDLQTERLLCDMRIHRYLSKDSNLAKHLKVVDILVIAKTPLGYKVIVNNQFEGLIYNNEIFTKIEVGDRLKGYVKKVRDDGKLDISLNPIGKNKVDTNLKKVVEVLKQNRGYMKFNYKSDAEDIKENFGMSKKAFKASLTKLLELNQIELKEEGVWLK